MLTREELRERILKEYDVDLLCEILYITADDILDCFEDRWTDPDVISKFGWLEEQ